MRTLLALALLGGTASADTITTTTSTTTTTTVTIAPDAPVLQPPSAVGPVDSTPTASATAARPHHAVWLTLASGGGFGFDTKDGCADLECMTLSGSFAVSIGSRLAAVVSGIVMNEPGHLTRGAHHVETVGLRYALPWWSAPAGPRLWTEAGIGVGSKRSWMYAEPPPMDLSGVDPAASVAVGYDALVHADYALGLQARVASTITDVHHTSFASLGLGVTFF